MQISARKGSILFTSISMVSVFLTLVVAATAYVNTSQRNVMADRFRDTAEQAAHSGLEWVMGYAQQNIDTETRLPREWGRLADGEVINPVSVYLMPLGVNVRPRVDTAGLAAGDMLGACGTTASKPPGTTQTGVGEYVLSVQGKYVVTFKARIQQYAFAESLPRQYRVGVVGRVRLADPRRTLDVNTDERDSIVAESFLVCNIGQVPTSRYAALIDIDGVRNWVPGEVVNGPVHVNRGYVDSQSETTTGTPGGTQYVNIGMPDLYGGTFNYNYTGPNNVPAARTASFTGKDIRSTMNIRTSVNSPFGSVVDPVYGTMKTPRFNDEVSITVVDSQDPPSVKATYPNLDPHSPAAGIASGGVGAGTGILIDGQSYCAASLPGGINWTDIFQAPENQVSDTKHFGTTGVGAGPTVLNQPVAMPSSVRNRLMTVVGAPASLAGPTLATPWANLPDGLYIPTQAFWNEMMAGGLTGGNNYPGAGLGVGGGSGFAAGGLYLRGNVEIMRMGVSGKYSYYLFQMGYGGTYSGANPKRSYCVVVDRTSKEMWLCAYAIGAHQAVPGLGKTGGSTSLAGLVGVPTAGAVAGFAGPVNDARAFAMSTAAPGANGAAIFAYYPPPPATQAFPFNGVVFVDIARLDLARDVTNPNQYNKFPPITGNIFALGDLGTPGNPTAKRTLDGVPYEQVATYQGTNYKNTASSLTIMATGNIFVQNDVALSSINQVPGITSFPGLTFADGAKVTLNQTRDLLGLVSDKQVVLGLAAPSTTTRANKGVAIHAAIAALGDPGYDWVTQQANPQFMKGNDAYRGSFATEGLMQYYNLSEEYAVCDGGPNKVFAPTAVVPPMYPAVKPANAPATAVLLTSSMAAGEGPDSLGYPGIPMYKATADGWGMALDSFLNNPNATQTRGRAVVFGAVTVKKRGIIGKGDTSYDKRFLFDRRLLTIAPPIFPSSTNVVVRTTNPAPPAGLPYWPAVAANPASLEFMEMITRRRGFTLVEILLVVIIIGIMTSVAMANFRGMQDSSANATATNNLREVALALERYRSDRGQLPNQLTGLDGAGVTFLVSGNPNSRGGYLAGNRLPRSPWANPNFPQTGVDVAVPAGFPSGNAVAGGTKVTAALALPPLGNGTFPANVNYIQTDYGLIQYSPNTGLDIYAVYVVGKRGRLASIVAAKSNAN